MDIRIEAVAKLLERLVAVIDNGSEWLKIDDHQIHDIRKTDDKLLPTARRLRFTNAKYSAPCLTLDTEISFVDDIEHVATVTVADLYQSLTEINNPRNWHGFTIITNKTKFILELLPLERSLDLIAQLNLQELITTEKDEKYAGDIKTTADY